MIDSMRIKAFILAVLLATACTGRAQQAQEQEPAPVSPPAAPATWIVKLTTAIKDGSDAILNAKEAKAIVTAYTALEQRQAADLAVSETHVYVLGPAGTVLLSKRLER